MIFHKQDRQWHVILVSRCPERSEGAAAHQDDITGFGRSGSSSRPYELLDSFSCFTYKNRDPALLNLWQRCWPTCMIIRHSLKRIRDPQDYIFGKDVP
jgi:hypothetical protein